MTDWNLLLTLNAVNAVERTIHPELDKLTDREKFNKAWNDALYDESVKQDEWENAGKWRFRNGLHE